MSDASYERQHLALHAAGYINGAGTTQVTFGCQMTRMNTGHYALLLDASSGVVSDQSFVMVTPKGANLDSTAVVNDVSNTQKDIYTFGLLGASQDQDVEIALYRSVSPGR